MFEFEKPRIDIAEISPDGKYGRFVVEPLERGYGITLGNSLRRILLSALPGSAVSSVKFDNVLHEFSTIPGVKEDVTEIILNLKNLEIKNNSESPDPKIAYIDYVGEGEIKAGDIKVDQDVEIVNPDLHIATLSGGPESKLFIEITITKGRGYVEATKNKRSDQSIRIIPVDSLYTPVTRVNFAVDDTRVGQITDYDKLTFEVWTNGTITPDDAVSLGAKILSEHLNLFIDLSD
ncbi:MAG: DNA-directed RNA polymerase subunit alpha, partial [Clostridiales bacterium]|nr:DNA-directed RNA polymerase subunit alpha [Clostridiales bacterium]